MELIFEIFEDINPQLEKNNKNFLNSTVAHDDILPHKVWLQMIWQFIRYGERKQKTIIVYVFFEKLNLTLLTLIKAILQSFLYKMINRTYQGWFKIDEQFSKFVSSWISRPC